MSSILQVMIHCKPLQKYFLIDLRHHHVGCLLYRRKRKLKGDDSGAISGVPSALLSKKKKNRVCLACELDKVFLRYTAHATGADIFQGPIPRGTPLVTTEMLAAAWKCEGMNHLAGYEQRDAHEFFHAFLETVGQHIRQFQAAVQETLGPNAYNISPGSSPERENGKPIFGYCDPNASPHILHCSIRRNQEYFRRCFTFSSGLPRLRQ